MIPLNGKQYLKFFFLTVIVLTVVTYGLFRSRDFLKGPTITIQSPQNGSTLDKAFLTINGKAEHIAFITLNDRQIFVDENGNLREDLLLQNGYNVISIKATDRFNRKVERRLELVNIAN